MGSIGVGVRVALLSEKDAENWAAGFGPCAKAIQSIAVIFEEIGNEET